MQSNDIQLNVVFDKALPKVTPSKVFFVDFKLSFNGEQLTSTLNSEQWNYMGDFFAQEFFCNCKFNSLKVFDEFIRIKALNILKSQYEYKNLE